jgi:hypothetical protein
MGDRNRLWRFLVFRPLKGVLPAWLGGSGSATPPRAGSSARHRAAGVGRGRLIFSTTLGEFHPVEKKRQSSMRISKAIVGRSTIIGSRSSIAAGIACSRRPKGCSGSTFFAGVHCLEKRSEMEEVRYFGSIRAFFEKPEVAAVRSGFGSFYLLHGNGEIDRRAGMERLFSSQPRDSRSEMGGVPLVLMAFLGGIVLRSPRRVPPGE